MGPRRWSTTDSWHTAGPHCDRHTGGPTRDALSRDRLAQQRDQAVAAFEFEGVLSELGHAGRIGGDPEPVAQLADLRSNVYDSSEARVRGSDDERWSRLVEHPEFLGLGTGG